MDLGFWDTRTREEDRGRREAFAGTPPPPRLTLDPTSSGYKCEGWSSTFKAGTSPSFVEVPSHFFFKTQQCSFLLCVETQTIPALISHCFSYLFVEATLSHGRPSCESYDTHLSLGDLQGSLPPHSSFSSNKPATRTWESEDGRKVEGGDT